MRLQINSSNKLRFYVQSSTTDYSTSFGTTTITNDGNFHHIEIDRYENTITLYLEGVAQGTVDVTGITVNNSAYKFTIGRLGEYDGVYFKGWIDEFIFKKGVALHTADFTPPTSEYAA
jgi:imidazoleglycerol phosphate dehydratase HisB